MAPAYFVLFLFFVFEANAAEHESKFISLGSSLSPIDKPSWLSPSGRLAFGFYKQGSGFSVGTFLTTTQDITVIWTANRDDPPVSSNATLTLTKDGQLILIDESIKDKIFGLSESASFASMSDSGNFALHNESSIIWSSFEVPTDTILGGQSLYRGHELISSVSETNSSTGQFRLKMQEDGNLVSYPINTVDDSPDAYWANVDNYRYSVRLYLNDNGELSLLDDNSSTLMTRLYSDSSFYNSSIIYRATLGHDGIFRMFSHYFASDSVYNTSVLWRNLDDQCLVKTFCGPNSYCTLYDDQPQCRCLPGTDYVDSEHTTSGCERYFAPETCESLNRSTESYNMTPMARIKWDDYPYFEAAMRTAEDCGQSCLQDCHCDAALYDGNYCTKQKFPLKYARREQGEKSSAIAYFKLSMRNITSDNGVVVSPMMPPPNRVTSKKTIIVIVAMTSGFITCSCVFLAISGFFILKYRVAKYKWMLETGNFGSTDELNLRSFSYGELKKATNGFKDSLGRGSFGTVYKGALCKGKRLVAVKRLEKVMNDRSEREFQAEMHVIGRIHHRNLVRLLGFCADDSKRLLVYEYMSNGSLADLLFDIERSPDWNERVRIALDVARGILYLHDECQTPVIHCDIKPQNILMDKFWTAKISDFGLAKLLMPDQTKTFTVVRGTRGYMAPEWSKNIPLISVKADVYSYGVVLLEIVCCRKNLDVGASKPEEIVLINWVYKCFVNRELKKLVHDDEVDKKTLENMVKVGLWCVQDEPALRPSMKSVVMMLEGITDVSVPPCPNSAEG